MFLNVLEDLFPPKPFYDSILRSIGNMHSKGQNTDLQVVGSALDRCPGAFTRWTRATCPSRGQSRCHQAGLTFPCAASSPQPDASPEVRPSVASKGWPQGTKQQNLFTICMDYVRSCETLVPQVQSLSYSNIFPLKLCFSRSPAQ